MHNITALENGGLLRETVLEQIKWSTIGHYFLDYAKQHPDSAAMKALKVYQTTAYISNGIGFYLNSEFLRRNNAIYESIYTDLMGFHVLDTFLLTAGKVDLDRDGLHYSGPQAIMQAMVLLNMLCFD